MSEKEEVKAVVERKRRMGLEERGTSEKHTHFSVCILRGPDQTGKTHTSKRRFCFSSKK